MIARQNTRFWCSASCVHFTTRVVPIDTEFRELFGSVQKTIAIAVAVELFMNDPIAQFAVLGRALPPRPCCHFCLYTADCIMVYEAAHCPRNFELSNFCKTAIQVSTAHNSTL